MKSFISKLAVTVALFAALFGASKHCFATTVVPGDIFDISYDVTGYVDDIYHIYIPPYSRALWKLVLLTDVYSGTIQVDVFDSGNTALGSELVNLESTAHYDHTLDWATVIAETTDPIGHVRFTSVSATFDVDLAHSSVVVGNSFILPGSPLPSALPLFATGLGALGLLGWRRKRKNAALAAA